MSSRVVGPAAALLLALDLACTHEPDARTPGGSQTNTTGAPTVVPETPPYAPYRPAAVAPPNGAARGERDAGARP